jgi:transcriptional regulator with XRE-family HTH domain
MGVKMDSQKIGKLIMELRKSKKLTQKGLADILNVTDKAVSKWERGVGYPEITLIPELAEALDISVSELLNGRVMENEKLESGLEDSVKNELYFSNSDISQSTEQRFGYAMAVRVKTDDIVTDVIEYSEEVKKQKASKLKSITFIMLNSAFLLAIFICMLCNYAINRRFDWSLYVIGSEVTAWLIISPFFLLKKHRFAAAMAGLSISILPLLRLIEYLCPVKNWVLPFAIPIVGMSLVCMWAAVLISIYTKINKTYLISFLFILFGIALNLSVNFFVISYLNSSDNDISNYIVAISCGFIAAILFITAYIKNRFHIGAKIEN